MYKNTLRRWRKKCCKYITNIIFEKSIWSSPNGVFLCYAWPLNSRRVLAGMSAVSTNRRRERRENSWQIVLSGGVAFLGIIFALDRHLGSLFWIFLLTCVYLPQYLIDKVRISFAVNNNNFGRDTSEADAIK